MKNWEEVMQEVSSDRAALLARISKIVEHLMQKDSSYQYYLDKDKAIQMIFKYYSEKVSIEKLKAMSDLKLTGFVEGDMMTLLLIEGEADINLKAMHYI
ncbi:MAG: hypothetical protein KME38_14540 [Spirirestis rafaelensis WJT71-NPBG6]|jgi:hypothetical protein|nr:hypothetical protein [Spirirestis rafaelensis WJT71-NPBG6]